MENQQKKPGKTMMQRIFSSETALCVVGLACIGYGIANGLQEMPIFFGICIVAGSFVLRLVRKKDWDAHWEEQERVRQNFEQRREQEKKDKK